ncbi:hypothetical protein M569_07595, partial [Genlisea aurea]
KLIQENEEDDEDLDVDAFEALFQQLEDDLKNDELNGDEDADDDMDEVDLANLEKELASALEDDDLLGALDYSSDGEINETEDNDLPDDKVEEDEEVDMPVKLKNWQIRRLAYALKNGRRKTAIKSLAAELCLDRVVILKLLRDPPPNLMMMAATLPDRPISVVSDTAENPTETTPSSLPEPPVKQKDLPVHLMQQDWIARKRLKKIHIQTLERVYRRTKRPTNAMIGSIVHVTNLPWRKVLKWFEDKRAEEGVPERRIPYTRSPSQSVFS